MFSRRLLFVSRLYFFGFCTMLSFATSKLPGKINKREVLLATEIHPPLGAFKDSLLGSLTGLNLESVVTEINIGLFARQAWIDLTPRKGGTVRSRLGPKCAEILEGDTIDDGIVDGR